VLGFLLKERSSELNKLLDMENRDKIELISIFFFRKKYCIITIKKKGGKNGRIF
jgi:hypothetical protein